MRLLISALAFSLLTIALVGCSATTTVKLGNANNPACKCENCKCGEHCKCPACGCGCMCNDGHACDK